MTSEIWADALAKIAASGKPLSAEAWADLMARAEAEAKAEGAREAVERIRARLDDLDDALYLMEPSPDVERPDLDVYGLRLNTVEAILDEEAAR
jgi:hypothetical protein